jgi:AbrB family looped-hinge helix DNA binding protein
MLSAKVSTKNQISLPSELRRTLGIAPGDRVSIELEGDHAILRRKPTKASERLRGLGKGLYEPDPVTFVCRLRDEWDRDADERIR